MRSLPRRILVCHGEQFAAVRTLHFRGAGDGSGKTGFVGDASGRDHLQDGQVLPAGIEPSDVNSFEKHDLRQTPNQRAAECAAVGDDLPPINPDLAQVIEIWDTLPPALREAILAMLRAVE